MEDTIFLPTGAWYDPLNQDFPFCQHGNPNVLTKDYGTSKLGQGPTAHSTLVQIRKYKGTPDPYKFLNHLILNKLFSNFYKCFLFWMNLIRINISY